MLGIDNPPMVLGNAKCREIKWYCYAICMQLLLLCADVEVLSQGSENKQSSASTKSRDRHSASTSVEPRDLPRSHSPHFGPGKGSGFYNGFGGMNAEGEGHGMFWEADECAYGIRDGRKEGRLESLDESLVIMKVMDEVRRQGGMKLPDKIETTDYPVDL